ncbi:MAG: hypothetical protein OXJ64_04380 [Boseongicola sp.]|nr:hypothetical protein [Boseongicola sp.]
MEDDSCESLDLDDEVMVAVKTLARRDSQSLGEVVSRLLRDSLASLEARLAASSVSADTEYGFRPFPKRGGIVTNALIDRLRGGPGE